MNLLLIARVLNLLSKISWSFFSKSSYKREASELANLGRECRRVTHLSCGFGLSDALQTSYISTRKFLACFQSQSSPSIISADCKKTSSTILSKFETSKQVSDRSRLLLWKWFFWRWKILDFKNDGSGAEPITAHLGTRRAPMNYCLSARHVTSPSIKKVMAQIIKRGCGAIINSY